MKRRYNYACPTCRTKLQKRGLTAAGTQRWYCSECTKSSCRARPDLARKLLLERFTRWLLDKESQTELAERMGYSVRTWRNKIAQCWDVIPPRKLGVMPESPGVIMMDGTRVASLICLVMRTLDGVLGWQFCPWECSHEWEKLIFDVPEPKVVVVDGQKGVIAAIARCWPETRIQRCHFHIWMNMRSKLTLRPKTTAGQELLSLARILLRGIDTTTQRDKWIHELYAFGERYKTFINERTYGEPSPATGRTRWWYTHRGLRSAYRQLTKLVEDRQLFAYLEVIVVDTDTGEPVPIPRTTNHVEGGINSRLRDLLKLYRGLLVKHQIRLADWYLHTRKARQKPPRNFL